MKTYVKPELFYEDLQLSQHIATCSIDVNSNVNDTSSGCNGIVDDYQGDPDLAGITFFLGSSCSYSPDQFEDYCDTNGTDEAINRIWNS